MTSDPLRRLTAGLAEEERIARAIDDKQADSGWGVSYNPYGLANTPPGWYITPHIGLAYESEGAEHISRQDPKATLDRVEAIRRLLRRHEEAERDSALSERDAGFEAGLYAALEALACIYPEDTEETGAANV